MSPRAVDFCQEQRLTRPRRWRFLASVLTNVFSPKTPKHPRRKYTEQKASPKQTFFIPSPTCHLLLSSQKLLALHVIVHAYFHDAGLAKYHDPIYVQCCSVTNRPPLS